MDSCHILFHCHTCIVICSRKMEGDVQPAQADAYLSAHTKLLWTLCLLCWCIKYHFGCENCIFCVYPNKMKSVQKILLILINQHLDIIINVSSHANSYALPQRINLSRGFNLATLGFFNLKMCQNSMFEVFNKLSCFKGILNYWDMFLLISV